MDLTQFGTITEMLVTSRPRHAVVRLLAGGTLGVLLGLPGLRKEGAAQFGCLQLNKRCRRDDQCCSGRCRGPDSVRRCRTHHAEDCTVDNGFCRSGGSAPGRCGPNGSCDCNVTTGRPCTAAARSSVRPFPANGMRTVASRGRPASTSPSVRGAARRRRQLLPASLRELAGAAGRGWPPPAPGPYHLDANEAEVDPDVGTACSNSHHSIHIDLGCPGSAPPGR